MKQLQENPATDPSIPAGYCVITTKPAPPPPSSMRRLFQTTTRTLKRYRYRYGFLFMLAALAAIIGTAVFMLFVRLAQG